MRILKYTACAAGAAAMVFLMPSAEVHAEQSEAGSQQTITYGYHDWFPYDTDSGAVNTYHLNIGDSIVFYAYEDKGEVVPLYHADLSADELALATGNENPQSFDHIQIALNIDFPGESTVLTEDEIKNSYLTVTAVSGGVVSLGWEDGQQKMYTFAKYTANGDGTYSYSNDDSVFPGVFVVNPLVTFSYNGAGDSDTYKKVNVTYNTSLVRPDQDPVVKGYTFTGWYTDPECTTLYDFDNGQALTSDLTLYAGWQIQQRTITFDYNGKGDNSQSSVDYGSMISAPADPSVQGYTFTGWYTDPACTKKYDFSRAVIDNLTLYAGWDVQTAVVSSTNADSNRTSPQTGVNTMLTGLYVVFGGALAVFGAAFASAMYIRKKFPR